MHLSIYIFNFRTPLCNKKILEIVFFHSKSDKFTKIANFKIYKIGLNERLGLYSKKAP